MLLDKKVSVDRVVSASKKRMTALMMAAERGYLDMARQFVHAGAVVELLGELISNCPMCEPVCNILLFDPQCLCWTEEGDHNVF